MLMGFYVGRSIQQKPRPKGDPVAMGTPKRRIYHSANHIRLVSAEWWEMPGSEGDTCFWRLKTLGKGGRGGKDGHDISLLFSSCTLCTIDMEIPRRMNDNHKHSNTLFSSLFTDPVRLDNLLESTVDGRPDSGVLPELDRRDRALGDALGGELELLQRLLEDLCDNSGEICGQRTL